MLPCLAEETAGAVPIELVRQGELEQWRAGRPRHIQAWVESCGFTASPGKHLLLPAEDGRLAGVLLGIGDDPTLWSCAGLPSVLPPGIYQIAQALPPLAARHAALGWALGTYAFQRYRQSRDRDAAALVWPAGADRGLVERTVNATTLVRDLVNTPAQDLGPAELAEAAATVAAAQGASCRIIEGDELLALNYPMIHAVGRASARQPRLVDLTWGSPEHPKVTLVGKGVCFDSGGLDLKTSSGMSLMKKDMGGAATVLGLALMVMDAGLKLRLRMLLPAVENAVSGNAFRPGDVLTSRKGLTVEIGNTDAEGRLVLADALTEAAEELPELLIDCATLTGAARVAIGPELPALFSDDDVLVAELGRHASREADPHWRLPLHAPYRSLLDSKIADINNTGEGGFAGAITAALFLKEFVGAVRSWAHIDLYAWNAKARPGRPAGGEAMTMRSLYGLLAERYPG